MDQSIEEYLPVTLGQNERLMVRNRLSSRRCESGLAWTSMTCGRDFLHCGLFSN
jgi:hypothetical protein